MKLNLTALWFCSVDAILVRAANINVTTTQLHPALWLGFFLAFSPLALARTLPYTAPAPPFCAQKPTRSASCAENRGYFVIEDEFGVPTHQVGLFQKFTMRYTTPPNQTTAGGPTFPGGNCYERLPDMDGTGWDPNTSSGFIVVSNFLNPSAHLLYSDRTSYGGARVYDSNCRDWKVTGATTNGAAWGPGIIFERTWMVTHIPDHLANRWIIFGQGGSGDGLEWPLAFIKNSRLRCLLNLDKADYEPEDEITLTAIVWLPGDLAGPPLTNVVVVPPDVSGAISYQSGPTPPVVPRMSTGQTNTFTFKYRAASEGPIRFQTQAHGDQFNGDRIFSLRASVQSAIKAPALKIQLDPNRAFETNEQFVANVIVRHYGVGEKTYRFRQGILDYTPANVLFVGNIDVPESFTLSEADSRRTFTIPIRADDHGVATLTSTIWITGAAGNETQESADAKAIVSPFDVGVKVTPKNLPLNLTPASKLGARSRAYNTERQNAGLTKFPNLIEIELTVTNASDETVQNVSLPAATDIHALLTSKSPDNPGVPLTPIRLYTPANGFVELTNEFLPTLDSVTLEPGQTATYAWLVNAFDGNTDPLVDDSVKLEFKATVLGSLNGENVRGFGKAEFEVVDKPLLEWGVRPLDGRTSFISGQAVRVEAYIENISARDGGDGREIIVMVYQKPSDKPQNLGGGFMFDSTTNSRTPEYYSFFPLPPTGESNKMWLTAILKSFPTLKKCDALVEFGVRIWLVEENGSVTNADSQAIIKEGWQDEFGVTLAANEPVFSERDNCIQRMGMSPFFCGTADGGIEFVDGIIGLTTFLFKAGESIAHLGPAIASHDFWTVSEMWRALQGDPAALEMMNRELWQGVQQMQQLGVVTWNHVPSFAEFSRFTGDTLGGFFEKGRTGSLTQVEYEVGKFLGSNPDLVLEPLVVARAYQKMLKGVNGLEGNLLDNVKAASKQRQADTLAQRLADADPYNLDRALQHGDVLTPDLLKAIYGIDEDDLQKLQKISSDNEVIITFRSRHPLARILLANEQAWPKPQALKFKCVNDIDVDFLGYPELSLAKVEIIEPPAALRNAATPEALETALNNYMDALMDNPNVAQRLSGNTVLYDEVKERMRVRTEEWQEHVPTLGLTDGASTVKIPVNFDAPMQFVPGQLQDYVKEAGAKDYRKVISSKRETSVTDPATGESRRSWEVKMTGPDGAEARHVTGDVDFLAILDEHGNIIEDPERRRIIYSQLAALLGMQHGESYTLFMQKAREKHLSKHVLGSENAEAMVAIAPVGDQAPTAAYFVKGLSIMEGSDAAKYLPPRKKIADRGGSSWLRPGRQIEVRRADPRGEFMLIAGADINDRIKLDLVKTFLPHNHLMLLREFLARRVIFLPGYLSQSLGENGDAVLSRDPNAPVLQGRIADTFEPAPVTRLRSIKSRSGAAGEVNSNLTFIVWTETDGWQTVTPAQAIALGAPGVVDMAPMTILPLGARAGATSIHITALAGLGATGAFFELGDRIVINPGGTNQEFATLQTLQSNSSFRLAAGLRFSHASGEMIASLGPDTTDRDGDGLSGLQEIQQETNPDRRDTDGDGFSDGDEVRVGTDPLNPRSSFKLLAIERVIAGSVNVSWSALDGRTYVLEASDTLQPKSWRPVATNTVTGTTGTVLVPDTEPPSTQRFFRLRQF